MVTAGATGRSILSESNREQLAEICGEHLRFDEPLSRHTTLKIGGPADAWVAPTDIETLSALIRFCAGQQLPILAIGAGSNLLVRDGGVRGVVLATRRLRGLSQEAGKVVVEAGVSTGKLLSSVTEWELGGLEFLGGVPGSVGGGLVMNAGTYLGEFKDVTEEVESIRLADGERVIRNNQECHFVYRGSGLPKDEIVVKARLSLEHRPKTEIVGDVKALKARRKEREPKGASNAGSVFKNPKDDYAGRLIEAVGFKGTRAGQAECSNMHANWFVNHGGATAQDMLRLIEQAHEQVQREHGIDLKLEWKLIGED